MGATSGLELGVGAEVVTENAENRENKGSGQGTTVLFERVFWQEKIMTLGTKLEGWTRARDILEALDTFERSERAYDFSTGLKLSQCANVLP